MMTDMPTVEVVEARDAALEVLRHNLHGPCRQLPRTAGWGYPEPYTRDLMIAALGMLICDDPELHQAVRRTLLALAENQSSRGHIPSLAHDPEERGASDTTPLFLIGLALYRQACREPGFLSEAADRALTWMSYQSPEDHVMVGQLPTSDWRDEHWVLGFGLYVNCLVYTYLRMHQRHDEAKTLYQCMNRLKVTGDGRQSHVHDGLALEHKPYYALWSYKVHTNERFDLLGNSLAILSGLAPRGRSRAIIAWIEGECAALRAAGQLRPHLPPCLFPYIQRHDPDWRARYEHYNQPGEYHNGGIWPFICGFYISAVVAADQHDLAREALAALTELVRPARAEPVSWGFNEWFKAQDNTPQGQDWQTWSAAMYLYASHCVANRCTPFFDEVRGPDW